MCEFKVGDKLIGVGDRYYVTNADAVVVVTEVSPSKIPGCNDIRVKVVEHTYGWDIGNKFWVCSDFFIKIGESGGNS